MAKKRSRKFEDPSGDGRRFLRLPVSLPVLGKEIADLPSRWTTLVTNNGYYVVDGYVLYAE